MTRVSVAVLRAATHADLPRPSGHGRRRSPRIRCGLPVLEAGFWSEVTVVAGPPLSSATRRTGFRHADFLTLSPPELACRPQIGLHSTLSICYHRQSPMWELLDGYAQRLVWIYMGARIPHAP